MKKFQKYLPAIAAALIALVGIAVALSPSTEPEDKIDGLRAGLVGLAEAADQANAVSIGEKDYTVCMATAVSSALAAGASESVAAVGEGECLIPDLDVDVSACIALREDAPEGKDVPAAVELAIGPVLSMVKGMLEGEDQSKPMRAWASAVVEWIGSGRSTAIALIEDPSSGKFSLKGVTVKGCSPE